LSAHHDLHAFGVGHQAACNPGWPKTQKSKRKSGGERGLVVVSNVPDLIQVGDCQYAPKPIAKWLGSMLVSRKRKKGSQRQANIKQYHIDWVFIEISKMRIRTKVSYLVEYPFISRDPWHPPLQLMQ
jgi:hypothetical protein